MSNELKDRMQTYIRKHELIKRGDTLVIGLSGGPDSVCLFSLLSDISSEWNLHLIAVHVHHGIRGDEADRDAAFSAELAAAAGAETVERHVDAPAYARENGLTLEEAARILRYGELEKVYGENGADAIVLAHHRDDQAETVFMNLMRGTGPAGLAGMHPRSGHRIRPLLFAPKSEIYDYLTENHIKYMTDSTNSSPDHTRNITRNEWLPMVETRYPEARAHIAAAAEDVSVWQDYIRKQTERTMTDAGVPLPSEGAAGTSVNIPVDAFLAAEPAIQTEWIRMTLGQMLPGVKDVSRTHYRQLDELFTNPRPGRVLDLPGGISVRRDYECVIFEYKSDFYNKKVERDIHIPLCIPGETPVDTDTEVGRYLSEMVDFDTFNENKYAFFAEKDYTKFLDYDKIRNGLCLRRPREGDYFVLDAQGHRKRLNRFFIDAKVPREDRNHLVVADGSHIVWVLDRISEEYKVTERTQRILRIRKEEQ